MKDSPNLDLLRTIAVGLVVVSHLPGVDGTQLAKPMGHTGVAMFFVHTTLVLMMSLERQGAKAGQFFVRRFFRIYPLSMAVVVLMTLLMLAGGTPIDWGDVLSNLLLVQNLTDAKSLPAPLWTLPYEVQMYLVLPALFLVTRRPRALLWITLLLAGSIALAVAAGSLRASTLVSFVPCFLPGALAFVLGSSGRRTPMLLWAVVGAGAIAVPALTVAGVPETPLLWALCLTLGLAIPQCRQITSRPLAQASKTVATYSYGIYLTHVFALGLAFSTPNTGVTPLQCAAFLVLLPGLAYAAYRWIERPGMELGFRTAAGLQGLRGNEQAVDLRVAQADR